MNEIEEKRNHFGSRWTQRSISEAVTVAWHDRYVRLILIRSDRSLRHYYHLDHHDQQGISRTWRGKNENMPWTTFIENNEDQMNRWWLFFGDFPRKVNALVKGTDESTSISLGNTCWLKNMAMSPSFSRSLCLSLSSGDCQYVCSTWIDWLVWWIFPNCDLSGGEASDAFMLICACLCLWGMESLFRSSSLVIDLRALFEHISTHTEQ